MEQFFYDIHPCKLEKYNIVYFTEIFLLFEINFNYSKITEIKLNIKIKTFYSASCQGNISQLCLVLLQVLKYLKTKNKIEKSKN